METGWMRDSSGHILPLELRSKRPKLSYTGTAKPEMAMERRRLLQGLLGGGVLAAGGTAWLLQGEDAQAATFPLTLSDAQWRKRLSPGAYAVLRQQGTETAGTSPLLQEKRVGVYACAGCDQPLFSSTTKYESGTGWPSFWTPISAKAIGTHEDRAYGMVRTEVHCSRCGGHQGHVFDDGPKPTGLRYCINGLSLKFMPGKA
jgi:peptide-methionine (R)-S-oxide reductase